MALGLIGINAVGGNEKHCPHLCLHAECKRLAPPLGEAANVGAGDHGIILPAFTHCHHPFPKRVYGLKVA